MEYKVQTCRFLLEFTGHLDIFKQENIHRIDAGEFGFGEHVSLSKKNMHNTYINLVNPDIDVMQLSEMSLPEID